MPVVPNAGGFPAEQLSRVVPDLCDRKVIAVRGYHGRVGRAKVALKAISEMAGDLRDYQVVVYAANLTTARLARSVAKKTGLDVLVHLKGKLRQD